LNVGNTKITGSTLNQLENLKNLQVLDLAGCTLTDQGFENISKLKHLKELSISGNVINERRMQNISQLKELQNLTLYKCTFSTDALRPISKLKALTNLWLSNSKLNSTTLEPLCLLPGLESLGVDNIEFSEQNIELIGKISSLKSLCLYGSNVNDDALKYLIGLNLTSLNLQDTNITAEASKYLQKIKTLKPSGLIGFTIVEKDGSPQLINKTKLVRSCDLPVHIGNVEQFLHLPKQELERFLVLTDESQGYSFNLLDTSKSQKFEGKRIIQAILSGSLSKYYEQRLSELNDEIKNSSDNENIESYESRAQLLARIGKYRESLPDFEIVTRYMGDPYSFGGCVVKVDRTSRLFEIYSERAFVFNCVKDYKAAVSDANVALNIDSASVPCRLRRAYAYLKLGESKKALEDLNFVLEVDRKNTKALAYRAMVYEQLGQSKEANWDKNMASLLGFQKEYPY
jgi:tetratricopeptide (TPR) repeat protein